MSYAKKLASYRPRSISRGGYAHGSLRRRLVASGLRQARKNLRGEGYRVVGNRVYRRDSQGRFA